MGIVPENVLQDFKELNITMSKYGYHPCSYETFLKLKCLNKECHDTLKRARVWAAWKRKQPQNRVIRKKIKNSAGQTVGYEILGPRPEPELGYFSQKGEYGGFNPKPGPQWNQINSNHVIWEPYTIHTAFWRNYDNFYRSFIDKSDEVVVISNQVNLILEDYQKARYPKEKPSDIKPLNLTEEQINEAFSKWAMTIMVSPLKKPSFQQEEIFIDSKIL